MESLNPDMRSAADYFNEAVPILKEYVSIRCLSPAFDDRWQEHGEIDRAMRLYARFAQERKLSGASVKISEITGRTPALIVDIPGTIESQETVLLYGHLDKQPATAPWNNNTDPFEAVEQDDVLFGRGVADDGYALFAALAGIQAAYSQGVSFPRCIVLIESSEESGSPDLEAHLEYLLPELGEVRLVVCLDSGGLDFQRLWVTTSLRGNLVLTVDVEVLEHGVHSGSASGVVPSSFRILRELISRLEDEKTGQLLPEVLNPEIPQFYIRKADELGGELGDPLSSAFPVLGELRLMGNDGADRILNQTWRAALSVTGMEGIPDIPSGGNVLRPYTKAKLSLRLPPTVDASIAQDEIVELLCSDPPYGAKVVVEAEAPAQGWVAPEPAKWLSDALDIGSIQGYGREAGYCGEGGSIPFLATLGSKFPNAQFVATGVLGPGSNAHGPDESLRLSCARGVSIAVAHLLEAAGRELNS